MEKSQKKFWLLSNSEFADYIKMLFVIVLLHIINIATTLKYLEVQKAVQNGDVISNWSIFLWLTVILSVLTLLIKTYSKYYGMQMSKYLRFNGFRKYRKVFQIYEKGVRLEIELIGNLFGCFDKTIIALLNVYLAIKTAEMINLSGSALVAAVILLISGVFFGIARGKIRADIGDLDSVIFAKEGDLTKFYTFCRDFLENALVVLGIEHDAKIRMNIKTEILTFLPTLMRSVSILICTYGFVGALAENQVYSTAYIIMTAFTTLLTIAEYISDIVGNVKACIDINNKPELQTLRNFIKKEDLVLKEAKKNFTVTSDKKCLTIKKDFTADLNGIDKIRYYILNQDLHLTIGENILLIGQKGTGKTRLLQILESVFENQIMIYNDHTTVFKKFYDNFKSDVGWNYELIQRIAKGLKLKRLQLPEDTLKKLDLYNMNTGDMHLMSAMVMLYYAISKPEIARILIFDELLANVDKGNSKQILEFINEIGKEINCSIIFVGHSQQDEIAKYCNQKWTLKLAEDKVIVDSKVLSA